VNKVKRLLVGMLIVGAITAATASGTFATFNASTSNSATVTSGTLLLGNSANNGTACISTADTLAANTITAGNSNTCGVLFTGTLQPGATGGSPLTAFLDLTNDGNFNAGSSNVVVSACASTVNNVTIGGHTFAGDTVNAPLCNKLQAVIAEVTTSNGSTLGGSGCVVGLGSGSTPLTNCSYSPTITGAAGTYALGAWNAATTRHFVVDVTFPDTSDNRYQGQNAAVTLTWNLFQ
jgi:hypothetical protein